MTFYGLQLGRLKLGAEIGTSASAPDYEGATVARRGKLWRSSGVSASSAVIGGGATVRARARDLVRNNPWADNGVTAWAANCVGTGIRPRSEVEDAETRAQLHELWRRWVCQCDADGALDFYGQQAMAVRAVVESGEIFVRLRPRGVRDARGAGLTVPLQLQMIEADQVPLHLTRTEGRNRIVAGVEMDQIGRRVAYHMFGAHPGDPLTPFGGGTTRRVPAESVIHVFLPERPGQVRGMSWFASVLLKLRELDLYEDAELVRKKTAALFAGFITQPHDEEMPAPLAGDQSRAVDGDAAAEDEARLEAGTMQVLRPGEEVNFSSPADVGGTYEVFLKQQLHAVAAGIGVPYEALTGDLSQVNFSSIRAGLIEFRRRCLMFQRQVINHQLNRVVWREFVRQAVLSGALPSLSPVEFDEVVSKVRWIGQGFEYVQPLQDVQADLMAARAGFDSRDQIIAKKGGDPEQLDAEIAAGNARADGHGLVLDSDPRKVAKSGAAQPDVEDPAFTGAGAQ